ncbi:MotA/TolQ/ExbB proton channel family protein [Corallincola platygyrae]|uniref:MotA/TolQ/ExbB proton channel family protein n=1 Tax=Corallincola platygyrae TaxID=1193278 RepID=A0ABW4XU76_9GAMM
MKRKEYWLYCCGAAVVILTLLSFTLPPESSIAGFLLDRNSRMLPYPFTIPVLMWLVFAFGMAELWFRLDAASEEERQLSLQLLPEDEQTMLLGRDLGALYSRLQTIAPDCFLPRLLRRVILQFQSSGSLSQANTIFNSSLELYQHEIDLRYNIVRYISWLIPTLGFIGTVVGIALALADAGAAPKFDDPELLKQVTLSLGLAFYTTLLALLMSAILVLVTHVAQGREERALNLSGQYCLDNLINRLYERQGE